MTTTATHFDISQLPSIKDGMTAQEEAMKRRKTCRFIEEAGRLLKLPRVAVSTAMTFFHQFYAKHSFNDHDRFEVAVAAIVLAAKTEESPKKLNTVITECHKLKSRGMQAGRISQGGGLTPPPPPMTSAPGELDPKGEEFLKLKERILLLERVILHTIGFELSIDHPYKFFVEQIKKAVDTRQLKYKDPPKDLKTSQIMGKMMQELVQFSMSFANDSMHTSLCLQFPPQLIATACVYLAGQFAKIEPAIPCSSQSEGWFKVLGNPDVDSLASICIQIMDLIADRQASDSDAFKKIRAQLELLKSREDAADAAAKRGAPPPPPPPAGEPAAKRQKI
jgi:hypothetical protein